MHVLTTPRLTLRPPAGPDAEDIALWLADGTVARMLARVPRPYWPEDARDWIARVASRPRDLVYTIHRERLIGVVSIEYAEGEHGAGEPVLGYWLGARWHGRGFMTEAAGALLAHAFADRSLATVASSVFVDNPASLAVQRKLGFTVTGRATTWSQARQAVVESLVTRLDAAAFSRVSGGAARAAA